MKNCLFFIFLQQQKLGFLRVCPHSHFEQQKILLADYKDTKKTILYFQKKIVLLHLDKNSNQNIFTHENFF